jgi:DNA-binding transcriptional LysR family regulator
MELRHLRYFVAVAEELHFGRAANRLHTSQSSLSQQVRNLETELKVDLLRRVKRHVELTPAGSRFLREARGILAAAERAAGLARETARGESQKFVIGVSPETDWQFLGQSLRLFREHAPVVEVFFQNLTPKAQVEALHEGRIDIGFVGLPIEAEGVVTEVTGRERLVAAIPAKHPMARNGIIRLRDLSGEAYTLWPRHLSPGRYDQLLSIFRRAGDRDGRGASIDPDRSGNGRRGSDRRAGRSCDTAEGDAGSRLPSHRGSRPVHRIRGDVPAGRPLAAAGLFPP